MKGTEDKAQMKKFFQAIRQGDLATVRELLEKKPELISDTAKQPPKKDDGQSPLQVALKAGKFDIAEYLLDMGACGVFRGAHKLLICHPAYSRSPGRSSDCGVCCPVYSRTVALHAADL